MMLRFMLFTALTLSVLLSSNALFVADDAYGGSGCCTCGQNERGCTPPGKYYNGKLCPRCALPDFEIFQISTAHGPWGISVIQNLPLFATAQLDIPGRLFTSVTEGQCLRHGMELRLLRNLSGKLSLKLSGEST
jgi:hypothetical protein